LKDLRVDVFFVTYSSEVAIVEYRLKNEGAFPLTFSALPYLYLPSSDSILDIVHHTDFDEFTFNLLKQKDNWMKEHNIPLADTLSGCWSLTGCTALSGSAFVRNTRFADTPDEPESYDELVSTLAKSRRNDPYIKGLIRSRDFTLQPGDATSFTIKVELTANKRAGNVRHAGRSKVPDNINADTLIRADELAYSKIPKLDFRNRDEAMLYWSSFSLLRQCMMPPEGECKHNYYLFSREPKWGWGYGGQVFHESLAMLAYVYMDPVGAMNSQRIFMDRQRDDGYINYRTGPYLNETIETNGKPTSSAPWFNYQNLEIFKITGNRQFLKDAYTSGKKFYQYYAANRDSNNNGLCEWAAHAELESVRDARVAVWDQIGWASNFEGPDVNSMLVMEAKSLAEMAAQLGLTAEAKKWNQDASTRSTLVNKVMWDSDTKFYYNVNRNGQSFTFNRENDLKIKEIIGFLPLWAGIPDKERVDDLVRKLTDTTEFWRPYGIPSLSAKSDYYCPIGYWNGPVWVQWNYLIYEGLRNYGYDSIANKLAAKMMDNMIYHLKNDHVFWEFYSADDRQAGWNKTYVWAGIVGRILIQMVKW
jgi:hypothetical protein